MTKAMKPFILLAAYLGFTHSAVAQISQNMTLLGQWDNNSLPVHSGIVYNDCWGYASGGREYALLGSAQRIHFLDITDPAAIEEINSFTGGANSIWRDMKTYGNYAYSVADQGNEGLMIFDLSNLPASVSKANQLTTWFTRSHNIFIDEAGGRLYAVGINNGSGYDMAVLDLTLNPSAPSLIAFVNLPGGYVHDVYVRNHIAYCSHGNNGLYIYDLTTLTNPATPTPLKSITDYPDKGYNHSSWLTDDGQYLVFADEVPTGLGLKIADIVSDPLEITVTDVFRSQLLAPAFTNSVPHNPFILGNLVYVSYYEDGIQVFDLSNPLEVTRVGYYDTYTAHTNYGNYDGAWGVYPFLPSGNIIGSDILNGLFVLQYNALLPVEWGDFRAIAETAGIRLDWTVLLEKNNAGFTVERSTDGRNFQPIKLVNSKGDTEMKRNYQTWDPAPVAGWNYYRLKQTDLDGQYAYSEVTAAFSEAAGAPRWQIFPTLLTPGNPISIAGESNETLYLEWFDQQGKMLERWLFEAGFRREVLWPSIPSSGLYMLRVRDGDRVVSTQRIAVVK